MSLFDGQPDDRSKAGAPTQRVIGAYCQAFEQRTKERPIVQGRDAKALKALVDRYGEAKVTRRLTMFFADPFAVDSGFAIDAFLRSWNRLTAQEAAENPSSAPDVESTSRYLRSLRRRA